jgi:hypothetical protein
MLPREIILARFKIRDGAQGKTWRWMKGNGCSFSVERGAIGLTSKLHRHPPLLEFQKELVTRSYLKNML